MSCGDDTFSTKVYPVEKIAEYAPDAIPKSIHFMLPRSNMCKSLRHPIFSPIPPKIISRSSLVLGFPFRISVQVCRYLGDGPVPTQVKVFHTVFPPVKMIDDKLS